MQYLYRSTVANEIHTTNNLNKLKLNSQITQAMGLGHMQQDQSDRWWAPFDWSKRIQSTRGVVNQSGCVHIPRQVCRVKLSKTTVYM